MQMAITGKGHGCHFKNVEPTYIFRWYSSLFCRASCHKGFNSLSPEGRLTWKSNYFQSSRGLSHKVGFFLITQKWMGILLQYFWQWVIIIATHHHSAFWWLFLAELGFIYPICKFYKTGLTPLYGVFKKKLTFWVCLQNVAK